MAVEPILRVAVAAPVPGPFDYLPPLEAAPREWLPGLRLRVPFGRGIRIGMLLEVSGESARDPATLKRAEAVLDRQPLLAAEDLELLAWAAGYYRYPLGEVLMNALPARLKRGGEVGDTLPRGWRIASAGLSMGADDLRRAPRQAALMRFLRSRPRGVDRESLRERFGDCSAALRALVAKGWVEICTLARETVPAQEPVAAGPDLNPEQRAALEQVGGSFGGFQAFLLDGVTGSGKTEVYLRLIEQALAADRQVLILVPEIGLTPQLQRRLRRRIQAPIGLLHSGLSAAERESAWLQAAAGHVRLVLGTRSAVFAPLPRLGLVLVDEEHDLSLKQQDGFRYSARDLAVRRAWQRQCPVVLGSATPSLESLRNARTGRYGWLRLRERAGGASAPRLDLIDIRTVRLQAGLSPALLRLVRETLEAGNQVLLFLNRRGYAPILTCHACGWVAECRHCDARMTLHRTSNLLWCHHCDQRQRPPEVCPTCGSSNLAALGQGTERLAEALSGLFAGVPVARIDRDSTRRKGELAGVLEAVRQGRYPLLLGTQMLAKGHHLPDVTLVGILDVDQGLYGADYRAAERMAQLIMQVSGRAGRAGKPGRVVLQTRHPAHPLLQTLLRQGYDAFAREALQERREAGLPPFSFQALLRAEARDAEAPRAFLELAAQQAGPISAGQVDLWGPVAAPMERRAGRYRAQLLVQAQERPALQRFLAGWVPTLYRLAGVRRVRWSLDVDPQEML